eukprot:4499785-Prymnesium_polylepis.1
MSTAVLRRRLADLQTREAILRAEITSLHEQLSRGFGSGVERTDDEGEFNNVPQPVPKVDNVPLQVPKIDNVSQPVATAESSD